MFLRLHRSAQCPVSVTDNAQPVTLGSLSDSIPRHFSCAQALGDNVRLANVHVCLLSGGPALSLTSINLVGLKVWSLNEQQPAAPGTGGKCKLLSYTLDSLNQEAWAWEPTTCAVTSLPGDSDTLRTPGLVEETELQRLSGLRSCS